MTTPARATYQAARVGAKEVAASCARDGRDRNLYRQG